jgi:hypothetical protein
MKVVRRPKGSKNRNRAIGQQSVGHGAADRAALKWKLYLPRPGQRGRSHSKIARAELNRIVCKAVLSREHGSVAERESRAGWSRSF